MGQKASEIHVLWVPYKCNLLAELLKKKYLEIVWFIAHLFESNVLYAVND